MAIVGTARPPSPGASPAPYVTAWVYARYSGADSQIHEAVSFMVDTGADRTVLSLRRARDLIGDDWEAVCRTSITAEGIGGAQAYWEVPMRLWFWDVSVRSYVYLDSLVLVPFYSEVQDFAERHSERQGREPISLLGRDVFGHMRLEFDLSQPEPVVLR